MPKVTLKSTFDFLNDIYTLPENKFVRPYLTGILISSALIGGYLGRTLPGSYMDRRKVLDKRLSNIENKLDRIEYNQRKGLSG